MPESKKYASYDLWVKAAISSTGRADLFPSFKIPRTTANYWIKRVYRVDGPIAESLINALNETRSDSRNLRFQVEESMALRILLREVFEILGFRLRWRSVDSKEIREKILAAIEKAMVTANRNLCLEALDLSLSRYKRWRREKIGCGLPETIVCPRGSMSQLTFKEIQKMRYFVTSKEFSHFPIRSLHYFAKREGSLMCSYSSWRKYIDQYGWKRARKRKRKRVRKIGIRAKHPNEIWHLDVSHFVLPDGSKCYIQAIIDNYSRYVLAWQVAASYDGSKTGDLLQEAIEKTKMNPKSKSLRLIVDGGGENKGQQVKGLENQGHFKKQVARFEISFSNSMIETLFRSLKNNFLYHEEIRSLISLRKKTDFWFTEHNGRIPHTAFKGETPLERFNKTWRRKDQIRILVSHENAIKLRLKHNQHVFCKLCEVG